MAAVDFTSRDETTRSLRRVRRAQIAIFSLVGVALVGTAVNSFVGAGRVYQAVALGQGQGLLQALRRSLGPGGPPTRGRLEAILDANADLGLRCIVSFASSPFAETGEPGAAQPGAEEPSS